MTKAKETIVKSFLGNEDKYKEIFEIIDRRWEIQLHQPLHAARYFLNPEVFYYKPEFEHDKAIMRQLYKCIERMIKDVDTREKAVDELSIFIKAEGVLGMDSAIRKRKTKAPGYYFFFFNLIYYIIF